VSRLPERHVSDCRHRVVCTNDNKIFGDENGLDCRSHQECDRDDRRRCGLQYTRGNPSLPERSRERRSAGGRGRQGAGCRRTQLHRHRAVGLPARQPHHTRSRRDRPRPEPDCGLRPGQELRFHPRRGPRPEWPAPRLRGLRVEPQYLSRFGQHRLVHRHRRQDLQQRHRRRRQRLGPVLDRGTRQAAGQGDRCRHHRAVQRRDALGDGRRPQHRPLERQPDRPGDVRERHARRDRRHRQPGLRR